MTLLLAEAQRFSSLHAIMIEIHTRTFSALNTRQ